EGGYVQYYEDLETSTVYDTAGNFVRNAWVTITGEEIEPELLRGDVNGDGKVNVSDVTCLINMILGVLNVNEVRADVNQDGKVNVSDVTFLINIILGVIH
ncbi:MAG: dockerin type I repeat-containing protein, partial [Muribaculaceae bacterium]|nr:dockerin type I repeat-containing protein [Muribaculaceae bacterium]